MLVTRPQLSRCPWLDFIHVAFNVESFTVVCGCLVNRCISVTERPTNAILTTFCVVFNIVTRLISSCWSMHWLLSISLLCAKIFILMFSWFFACLSTTQTWAILECLSKKFFSALQGWNLLPFAFNTTYLYILYCLYVNFVAVCNNLLSFSDRKSFNLSCLRNIPSCVRVFFFCSVVHICDILTAYFCIIRDCVHRVFLFESLHLLQVTMASPTMIVQVCVNKTCLETFVMLLFYIHAELSQETSVSQTGHMSAVIVMCCTVVQEVAINEKQQ